MYIINYSDHNIHIIIIQRRAGRWEVEQAATSTSIEKRLCNDGVRYTWAEFKDYDDIFLPAEMWEAVLVVATP